jgi:hypothetical protein
MGSTSKGDSDMAIGALHVSRPFQHIAAWHGQTADQAVARKTIHRHGGFRETPGWWSGRSGVGANRPPFTAAIVAAMREVGAGAVIADPHSEHNVAGRLACPAGYRRH